MTITGATRVLGIFGDPVTHSRSPAMQGAALAAAGIDAVYLPFHVSAAQLPAAVRAIEALGLVGVNVTIPHKEAVCSLLDELDAEARLIGAVNTVVYRQGRLVGYNTDAAGFLRALEEDLAFHPQGRNVLLLGAGGACRAALVALARSGVAWLGIVNRSLERAQRLVQEFSATFPDTRFAALPLGAGLTGPDLTPVDLLVNTSAVGLHGESFEGDVFAPLTAAAPVYDMIYGRVPTPLLVQAKQQGRRCVDGLGMLAGQGEEAFALWFGQRPPAGVMRHCLVAEFSEK